MNTTELIRVSTEAKDLLTTQCRKLEKQLRVSRITYSDAITYLLHHQK